MTFYTFYALFLLLIPVNNHISFVKPTLAIKWLGFGDQKIINQNELNSERNLTRSLESRGIGKLLKKDAKFTYYWLAFESDPKFKSAKKTMLRTCDKKPIIRVTTPFAKVIRTEGSGYSRSGKLINISGCKCGNRFSCFEVVSPEKYPYGISSSANALNPFTSTAVNDIKAGTKIYVPQIDGLEIPPNGKEHNGCLIVGDEGYGFKGYHLDFFVYLEKYYGELDKQKSITKIDVFEGKNCDLLDYTFGLPKPKKFLKG